jgi:hypothetical protein
MSLRGIGWSKGQYSTLTITWTINGLPGCGGGRRARSDAIWYGTLGLELDMVFLLYLAQPFEPRTISEM